MLRFTYIAPVFGECSATVIVMLHLVQHNHTALRAYNSVSGNITGKEGTSINSNHNGAGTVLFVQDQKSGVTFITQMHFLCQYVMIYPELWH